MNRKRLRITVGFSGNPETFLFTGDSSSEKRPVDQLVRTIGGTSVNFALQVREFGAKVHLCLLTGNDNEGISMLAQLESRVDKLSAIPCLGATAEAFIAIQTDRDYERTLYSYKPAGYSRPPISFQVQSILHREEADVLVMTGIGSAEYYLARLGFETSEWLRVLNPRAELTAKTEELERILRCTDVLSLNEKEAQAYLQHGNDVSLGDLKRFRVFGPKIVLVTLGRRGLLVSGPDGLVAEIPTCVAGKEIDATGAGDALLAGFLSRFSSLDELRNATGQSVRAAAEFGSFVAGISVTKVGGANTITAAELEKFGEREKVAV
jgi:sugar/nucleoside kinase (ribokinase family)